MPAALGNINVTINGVPLLVQSYECSEEMHRNATRVTLEGFLTHEAQVRSGSGIGVSTDDFVSTPIGGYQRQFVEWGRDYADPVSDIQKFTLKMMGKEVKVREGTQGSYAYGVAQLSEGLARCVELGWITADEAKVEMRANISSTQYADQQAKYEADRIEQLEKELAELKAEKN